jgi:preprotein translocase subunit Sss1
MDWHDPFCRGMRHAMNDWSELLPVICLFSVLGIVGIGLVVFWIWVLVDCIKNEPSQGNDKLVWVLVILLLGWVGALVYFFARRPQRIRELGQ